MKSIRVYPLSSSGLERVTATRRCFWTLSIKDCGSWLGEGDSNTQMFLDFVNKGLWTSEFFLTRGARILDPSGYKIIGLEPEEDLILREGVRKMIRNPFWSRLWIV